jgi:hypothetical protein
MMMRQLIGTGAVVLTLLGGVGIASAQVADHGIVSGSERNLEQHPDTGGAATYGRGHSYRMSHERIHSNDRFIERR